MRSHIGLGISYNGYVMGLGFFLMNAIATKMFGQCISSSSISRSTSMGIAGVLHLAFYLFFILVDVPLNYIKDAEEKGSDEDYTQLHVPQSMTYVVIFCGAAVFAVGDAVWEVSDRCTMCTDYIQMHAFLCTSVGIFFPPTVRELIYVYAHTLYSRTTKS